jgi:hypothetical protein
MAFLFLFSKTHPFGRQGYSSGLDCAQTDLVGQSPAEASGDFEFQLYSVGGKETWQALSIAVSGKIS